MIFSWNICKRDDSFRGTFFCFFSLGTKTSKGNFHRNRNQSTFLFAFSLGIKCYFYFHLLNAFKHSSFFFRSFGRCEPLLVALCSAKPGYHWTGNKRHGWTPKNDGDWLEDDVSLTKKHSDFLLVPNGFFEGFFLVLFCHWEAVAFQRLSWAANILHFWSTNLGLVCGLNLRFWDSPCHQLHKLHIHVVCRNHKMVQKCTLWIACWPR